MSNTVKEALDKAGVPVKPLNRRVWEFLDAEGAPKLTTDVARELNEKPSSVSTTLSNMLARGMIFADSQFRLSHGSNPKMMKINLYRTNPRMRSGFELLRLPPASKPALALAASTFSKTPAAAPDPAPAETDLLDSMNVKQAFALYQRLHELFAQCK